MDDDLPMVLASSDERLVVAYFAALEDHIERWRQVGGQWEPYAGAVPVDSMQAAALGHRNAEGAPARAGRARPHGERCLDGHVPRRPVRSGPGGADRRPARPVLRALPDR